MARKKQRKLATEQSIRSQESRIPAFAKRDFSRAYQAATASGHTLMVVKCRRLTLISGDGEMFVRSIDGFGERKSGTRLEIRSQKSKSGYFDGSVQLLCESEPGSGITVAESDAESGGVTENQI